jgi:hypothetical protein
MAGGVPQLHAAAPGERLSERTRASISHLTRSALLPFRPRQDIRRLQDMTGNRGAKPKFKTYLVSYFHIDIA